MIIVRFGATYNTAYVFPRYAEVDTWRAERPAQYARVSGLPGAFDFWGDLGYPWSPVTFRKSFLLYGDTTATAAMDGTSVSVNAGSTLITGVGTSWLTSLHVGDTLTFSSGFWRTVATIWNDTTVDMNSNSPYTDTYLSSTITVTHTTTLDELIAALKAATIDYGYESKLWMLRRDGVTSHYAWAKCTGLKISDEGGQLHHMRAEVEFYGREGISHLY